MKNGGFEMLPNEVLEKIFSYISLKDIKNLRFLNSWFDERVCSLLPSVFGLFNIKEIGGFSHEEDIQTTLATAMEKPHFVQNKLKLLFSEDNEYHLNLVKVIVCKHAENIVLLGICFKDEYYTEDPEEEALDDSLDFLKQSDIMLDSLEGLIVQFDPDKEEDNIKTDIEVFEALVKRHANQLLQLEVVGLNYSNWQVNLTSLPMLRSLSLTDLHPSVALDLLAGCRQSIRKLKIDDTTFCDSTPEFDYDTLTATTFKVDGLNDLDISIEEHMMCRFVTDNSETLQSLVLKSKYWGEDMMQSLRLPHLTHLWIKVGMTPILMKCNMNIECVVVAKDFDYRRVDSSDSDDYYDVDYNSDYELLEDYDFNQRKHSSHYWVINAQMPQLTDLYLKNADLELVIHKNAQNLEFLIVRGNMDFENVELNKVHTVLMIAEERNPNYSEEECKSILTELCPNAKIISGKDPKTKERMKKKICDRFREKKWKTEFRDVVLNTFFHN